MFVYTTNSDIANMEGSVSEIMKIEFVKMRRAIFKVVICDIQKYAGFTESMKIASLECIVSLSMKKLSQVMRK